MRSALRRGRQRGVVLFIALIILVAMTLAGIALMRSVDTGTIIAGNLAFRQNTTYVGDLGVEAARAWLTGVSTMTTLDSDQTASGYYASWGTQDVLTGYNWGSGTTAISVTSGTFAPPSGYSLKYVIHRLCLNPGSPSDPNATCVKAAAVAAATGTGTQGAASYGTYALGSAVAAVYRVTVQVTGPRNSMSYVQSVVF